MTTASVEAAWWPGLKLLVKDLTGAAIVQDADEPREHQPGGTTAIYLAITARRAIGQTPGASYAEEVENDDGPVYETLERVENVTVRAQIVALDQTPGYKSDVASADLKLGLFAEPSWARLQALSLGMGEILFEGHEEDTADDLYRSVSILDMRFVSRSSRTFTEPMERIDAEASEDITGSVKYLWET